MSAVSLQSVTKTFGSQQVVKGLSLELEAGKMLALLGPSGCGKTTTLRMLAGLERADSGRISIDGNVVQDGKTYVPPEQRNLGMVFQSYAVWPNKTVLENVAYPLLLKKNPNANQLAMDALSMVQLNGLHARMPSQLSGGQLQRVAIARALVSKPKLLLLDEPLSNLDAKLREELRGELSHLRTQLKITSVLVTHDREEALALADVVAVMNQGVIEQVGSPQDLYENPKTSFVAKFVSDANCLKGSLSSAGIEVENKLIPLPVGTVIPAQGASVELTVNPHDVIVNDANGIELVLLAKLYLGSQMEYRFQIGSQVLKAIGQVNRSLGVGSTVKVGFKKVQVF
jgi:ABC-type Fe3+/spermidine/putrescine transport system ATPase subunit